VHVIVIGAGVVGMSTAYYLTERGCSVTVVDRADNVADGASHANGGQLSYSFTDALARPSFIAQLPRLLRGADPGSRIRWSPRLAAWGMRFLSHCTSRRAADNTLALLSMALRSAELMRELRATLDFDFAYRPAGKLVLLADDSELAAASRNTALKRSKGCDVELLDPGAAMALEPALAGLSRPIAGAVYSRNDEVADARLFCEGVRRHLESTGLARFRLGARADGIRVERGRATGVTGTVDERGDAVVVCLGAWSPGLLRTAGVASHIYPVRGYSITLPPGTGAPSVSITSLRDRIVFSRLNGAMRIAGFADFTGFDTGGDAERVRTLAEVARGVLPTAADFAACDARAWGGFRPMTPDGRPRVGASRVPGLFLNTGHGMLGWTLACASASDAADAVMKVH